MSFTAAQLEARRTGIGGSEIAAVLGMDPFKGPLDIYLTKVEGYEQPDNPDMERGRYLEPGIAEWYGHRENVRVRRDLSTIHINATGRVGAFTAAFCTPDAFAFPMNGDLEPQRLVSIKAPRFGHDWGETGGQHVPLHYVLQLQWEDMILATHAEPIADPFHLVAFVEGDLRIYPIARDRELQQWMLDAARRWWVDHVEAKKPPPLDGSAGAAAWLRRRFPRDTQPLRPATLDEQVLMMELRQAETDLELTEKIYGVKRQKLEQAIGVAAGIEAPAIGRITWRADKNGKRSFKPKWSTKPAVEGAQKP